MHALDQATRWTRKPRFTTLARELAAGGAPGIELAHKRSEDALPLVTTAELDIAILERKFDGRRP